MDLSTASIDTTLDPDDVPLKSYHRGVTASVVCGVCSETVLKNKWIDHIRLEHKYLAWKSGEPPLVSIYFFIQHNYFTLIFW